jgi:hypothetical protein
MDQSSLVPVIAILGVLAYASMKLYFRHRATELRHRERIAAIEKGTDLPPDPALGPTPYLLQGLKLLFTGIGLSIFLIALSHASGNPRLLAVATIGLIPAGIGIAHLVLYRIQSKSERTAASGVTASNLR